MTNVNELKSLLITKNDDLASFCESISSSEFITVDTEFMRESTYYSKLCLVQIAGIDKGTNEVKGACIDTLVEDLDLSPLLSLMDDQKIMKVFHAAFQDVEIFYHMTKKIPTPFCDTQVMAMVCGYKDSVSYKNLAEDITSTEISKSMQFTDWSSRPLSVKQLEYAMTDVIPLRKIYTHLKEKMEENNRQEWIAEEMEKLSSISSYDVDTNEVWRKIKLKSYNPQFLARLRELAKWREEKAQSENKPRKRILTDEILTAIAFMSPDSDESLTKVRTMQRDKVKKYGKYIYKAVKIANSLTDDLCPLVDKKELNGDRNAEPLKTMLKMLLSVKCAENETAELLIANAADITKFAASSDVDIRAMHGWRYEIFGKHAELLKKGEISLSYNSEDNTVDITKK